MTFNSRDIRYDTSSANHADLMKTARLIRLSYPAKLSREMRRCRMEDSLAAL